LALHSDSIDGKARYLTRPITDEELVGLVHGALELHQVFQAGLSEEWYFWDTRDEDDFEAPRPVLASEIPESYFPQHGIRLDLSLSGDQDLVDDAYRKQKPVVSISLDNGRTETIPAQTLTEVVSHFQSVVKYAYKKSISLLPKTERGFIDFPSNYVLNAYGSKAGSFKLLLESDSGRDLFSGFDITHSLDRIAEMVSAETEEIEKHLRENQGYAISSYSKMLQAVTKSNIQVHLSWVDPNQAKVTSRSITPAYANQVLEIIGREVELSKVYVTIVGKFELIDVKTGNWRVIDELGDPVNGTGPGELLKGVVSYEKQYTLYCEEVLVEESIAGKERTTHKLLSLGDDKNILALPST
jgi:hypothetical protein